MVFFFVFFFLSECEDCVVKSKLGQRTFTSKKWVETETKEENENKKLELRVRSVECRVTRDSIPKNHFLGGLL